MKSAEDATLPEIVAPTVSAIGTLRSLVKIHHEVWKWDEQDVEFDGRWLEFAVGAGRLEGTTSDYAWVSRPDVLAAELKGTHSRIQAVDVEKRLRYRILRDSFSQANVLMKKTGRATP